MIGWEIAVARRAAPMFALAVLGAGCDVSSVVGVNQSSFGALRCGESSPIERCNDGACVIRDLEPAEVGSTPIAVDDELVYYRRSADSIVKAKVTGGDVVDLASSGSGVSRMAVDATHLYWSEFGRRILRVPKAGGPSEVVADIDGHPIVLALDDTYVYATLTDTNQMAMTPKEPGLSTFLPAQNAPSWVATDATHVYWTNQGNGPNTGELVRAPLGELALVEVVASNLDSPLALALSAGHAYVIANTTLLRIDKTSGVAEAIGFELDEPKSVAVYSDSVYVTGISGLLRFRDGELATLDDRTTLGLAVACSGVFATGWLVPAILRYAP